MSQFHGSIDEGLALVISPESYRWLKVSTEFTNYCFCRTFIADILHTHHPLLSQNSLITLSSYNISIFTVSLINKWFYTIFHAWECLVLLTDTTRSLSQLVKHFYAEFSAVYNDIKMHRLLMANWIKCNLLFQVFFWPFEWLSGQFGLYKLLLTICDVTFYFPELSRPKMYLYSAKEYGKYYIKMTIITGIWRILNFHWRYNKQM